MIFCLGLNLALVQKVFALNHTQLYLGGGITFIEFVVWTKMLGSLAFTKMAWDIITLEQDEKGRAKSALKRWMAFSEAYGSDSLHWSRFNSNTGLNKKDVKCLMDRNNVILPDYIFNSIFSDIDANKNGYVNREELESYLSKPVQQTKEVLTMCLLSFNFWSSLAWFLGALAWTVSVYVPSEVTSSILLMVRCNEYYIQLLYNLSYEY